MVDKSGIDYKSTCLENEICVLTTTQHSFWTQLSIYLTYDHSSTLFIIMMQSGLELDMVESLKDYVWERRWSVSQGEKQGKREKKNPLQRANKWAIYGMTSLSLSCLVLRYLRLRDQITKLTPDFDCFRQSVPYQAPLPSILWLATECEYPAGRTWGVKALFAPIWAVPA